MHRRNMRCEPHQMSIRQNPVRVAQGAGSVDSPPVIDRGYLARFTLGNAALEREVLHLFAGQAPGYLAALAAAGGTEAWREAAHTLKGSAAAVGAVHVARLAEVAERLAPEKTEVPAGAEREQALAALREAVAIACRTIAAI